jgi:hypothetical protein
MKRYGLHSAKNLMLWEEFGQARRVEMSDEEL